MSPLQANVLVIQRVLKPSLGIVGEDLFSEILGSRFFPCFNMQARKNSLGIQDCYAPI
jgi:hypothetical protein